MADKKGSAAAIRLRAKASPKEKRGSVALDTVGLCLLATGDDTKVLLTFLKDLLNAWHGTTLPSRCVCAR